MAFHVTCFAPVAKSLRQQRSIPAWVPGELSAAANLKCRSRSKADLTSEKCDKRSSDRGEVLCHNDRSTRRDGISDRGGGLSILRRDVAVGISKPLRLAGQIYQGHRPPHRSAGLILIDRADHPGDWHTVQDQPRLLAAILGIAATSSFQWVRDLDGLQFGISNAVAVRATAPRPLIGYRLKVRIVA